MSKGSGGTRTVNSRTKSASKSSKYTSPMLKNGKPASSLTDEQLGYRLMQHGSGSGKMFAEDADAMRIEAAHRADSYINTRINGGIDSDVKAYKEAVSAFKTKYQKQFFNTNFSVEGLQLKAKAKERKDEFNKDKHNLLTLRKKAESFPNLNAYASDASLKKYMDYRNKILTKGWDNV